LIEFSLVDGGSHQSPSGFILQKMGNLFLQTGTQFVVRIATQLREIPNPDRNQFLSPNIEFDRIFCYNSGQWIHDQ
jgi:hypothetical protein